MDITTPHTLQHGAGLPETIIRPETIDELALAVQTAHAEGAVIQAVGAGTAAGEHPAGAAPDVLIDMRGLSAIVDHEPGDLVMVAQAGAALRDLGAAAGQHGQELLFDVPHDRLAAGSTLGGAISTAATGPRRISRLPLRDVVLGATVVLADGQVTKSGGKVVKNVAGYDLAKLVTGAWGSLGIVAQAAVRLYPAPEAQRFITVTGTAAEAAGIAHRIVTSQLAPAAVELNRDAAGTQAVCLLEGRRSSITARAEQLAGSLGLDPAAAVSSTAPVWWGRRLGTGVRIKATATLTGVAELLATAAALEETTGTRISVRGSAVGVLELGLGEPGEPVVAETVAAVLAALRRRPLRTGTATLTAADSQIRQAVDSWGPIGGIALMHQIKHRFDPEARMHPGRFAGGI